MRQTIAAVATGESRAAIGVIRLSGPRAVAAVAAVFHPSSGRALGEYSPRALVLGTVLDKEGRPIDRALATWSAAPASYTGEDTAELHCHGSPMVLALAMESLLAQGVRQAAPGEFTRRAVLAGKLDLTQAEAVIDLIDAETPAAVHASVGQLGGSLSRRAGEIYDGLVDLMAHFHAVLDYPDEEIDDIRAETIQAALAAALTGLNALAASYERGRQLVHGVLCAIVGKPNAGKSSLLNALLGFERAIVTASPGTTRDTIEERCTLGGVLLRLIDTAGLRDAAEEAERLGVARSRAALAEAALALLVIDGAAPLEGEDWAAMAAAETVPHVICVVNKADCEVVADVDALRGRFSHVCVVSALRGEGLDALAAMVAACFPSGQAEKTGALLTNARQFAAAVRAAEHLEAAQAGLDCGVSPDALLTDVELALEALGELTGRTVREDVISRVFERFCVGK